MGKLSIVSNVFLSTSRLIKEALAKIGLDDFIRSDRVNSRFIVTRDKADGHHLRGRGGNGFDKFQPFLGVSWINHAHANLPFNKSCLALDRLKFLRDIVDEPIYELFGLAI